MVRTVGVEPTFATPVTLKRLEDAFGYIRIKMVGLAGVEPAILRSMRSVIIPFHYNPKINPKSMD